MDLIGPFQPTAGGHKFVLTMTDFSKYVEAVPIPDKTAVSVAQGIYKVYCRQGAPVSIICDQGKKFVNQGMLLTNLIAAILQPLTNLIAAILQPLTNLITAILQPPNILVHCIIPPICSMVVI